MRARPWQMMLLSLQFTLGLWAATPDPMNLTLADFESASMKDGALLKIDGNTYKVVNSSYRKGLQIEHKGQWVSQGLHLELSGGKLISEITYDQGKRNGPYRKYTIYNGEDVLETALAQKFDVAINHTVLEHIEWIQPAFENIAHLTREALITVVPFLQDEHYAPGIYGDYWRYPPLGLKALYEQHGFTLIYLNANDTPWYPVYLTAVGVRHPEKFPDFPKSPWGENVRVGRSTYVYPKCAW